MRVILFNKFVVGGPRPCEAPYSWRHARLSKLRDFLVEERKSGRYHPVLSEGLD